LSVGRRIAAFNSGSVDVKLWRVATIVAACASAHLHSGSDDFKLSRILLVDDDHATRIGLAELLTDAGYETRAVATFEEGLRALRNGNA
jgi:PleD family two-component response regulator